MSEMEMEDVAAATGYAGTIALGYVAIPIIIVVSVGRNQKARNTIIGAIGARSIKSLIALICMFYGGKHHGATTFFWFVANYLYTVSRACSYAYLYLKAQVVIPAPFDKVAMIGCVLDILHDLVYRALFHVQFTSDSLVQSSMHRTYEATKISHEALGICAALWYQIWFMYGIRQWQINAAKLKAGGNKDNIVTDMTLSNGIFIALIVLIGILDGVFELTEAIPEDVIVFDFDEILHQLWLIFLVLDFMYLKHSNVRHETRTSASASQNKKTESMVNKPTTSINATASMENIA